MAQGQFTRWYNSSAMPADLGFLGVVRVEVTADEQHPGHEQRRIDGR